MNLFPFFKSSQQTVTAPVIDTPVSKPKKIYNTIKRSFSSVFSNTLTDLLGSPSLQQDLRHLKTLRDQARTLAINNVYARRYIEIMKAAVIGANGISVNCAAVNPDGSADVFSDSFTQYFAEFSDDISVCGQLTRSQAESLMLERMIVDGEALAIIHRGEGDHGIKIAIIDADHLDENYNDYFYATGNRVVGGVEINNFGKPIAYHIFKYNPSDAVMGGSSERIRYDAEDIIHLYEKERTSATRGYSWLCPAIEKLHQLDKYSEAVLVSARIGASKSRYFAQTTDNADPFADSDDVDDEGHVTLSFSPGTVELMPRGWTVHDSDLSTSTQDSLDAFQKALLRGIAVGLGVSYHLLASDLSEVNYSAARFGSLTDNEFYKSVQSLVIQTFTKRLYREWLRVQLVTNALGFNIPFAKYQKFAKARYTAKAFGTVDPQKDAAADQIELENNLVSLSELAERRGRNLEDILKQKQKDDLLLEKYGQTKEAVIGELKKAA